MLFVDYLIQLAGDNIVFDAELKASSLNISDGDMFVAKIDEKGQLIFVKIKREQQ